MAIPFTLSLAFFTVVVITTGRVVITLYALTLGAPPFTVSVLAAMVSLVPTLLSWHIGKVSDRFGTRWLILLGIASAIAGMLIAYMQPGIPSLFAAAVLFGLLYAFTISPFQNMVGLLSGPADRAMNFSNLSLVFSFSGFVGPLLAGLLIDQAGPRFASLVLVLMLLLPASLLMLWGGILPGGVRDSKSTGGVRRLLAEAGLWRILLAGSLVFAGVDLFQVFLPIYGHGIGLSASEIGTLLALFSLAAFVVRIFLPALIRRFSLERSLACSFILGTVGFCLIPLFKGMVILSLISFLFGLGMGFSQPITLMMTFSSSVQGHSGEAMGLRLTVNFSARVLSQFIFGSVASAFGVLPVFWINALLLASGWIVSRPGDKGPAPSG